MNKDNPFSIENIERALKESTEEQVRVLTNKISPIKNLIFKIMVFISLLIKK